MRKRTPKMPDRAFSRFYISAMMPAWVRQMRDRSKMTELADQRGCRMRAVEATRYGRTIAQQVIADTIADTEVYALGIDQHAV